MYKNTCLRQRKESLLCPREQAIYATSCFSGVWLWDPMDCSLPESSVHGILQARILEWVAIPFSWGSSLPRDQTRDSYVSWTGRWVLYYYCHWGSPNLFFREDCKYQKPTVKWDIYKPAEVPRQRNTIETGGSYQKVPDLKQKQTLSASANFLSLLPKAADFTNLNFSVW